MNGRIMVVQRIAGAVLCSALVFILIACGPSSPSEGDGQSVLAKKYNTANTKITEFKKTNGQDINGLGAQGYRMSYEATIQCTSVRGCCISYGMWWMGSTPCNKAVKNGELFTTSGKIFFEKSEKGWLGKLEE
jgi:hypothetical protein